MNLSFWAKFQEVVASRGDFLHPDFPSNDVIAVNMCGVTTTLEKFKESVSNEVLMAFFTRMIEFVMVLRNIEDDSAVAIRNALQSQGSQDAGVLARHPH